MLFVLTSLMGVLVWVALDFKSEVKDQFVATNAKFDEANKRLSALETGQATMSVKIDGNASLKGEILELRSQVRELEREMRNGPVQ